MKNNDELTPYDAFPKILNFRLLLTPFVVTWYQTFRMNGAGLPLQCVAWRGAYVFGIRVAAWRADSGDWA